MSSILYFPAARGGGDGPGGNGASGGGEAERRRQLGQRLDARDVEVPPSPGAVQVTAGAPAGLGALDSNTVTEPSAPKGGG